MKNNFRLIVVALAAIVAMINLESCSSYHGIASKPDGHNKYHPDFALHVLKHHNSNYYNNHGNNSAKATANNTAKASSVVVNAPVSITPKTTGDISSVSSSPTNNEVTKGKNGKDIYKLLTQQERQQAREAVDKALAKRPIMRQMVDGRLNKLNEKYPAAAESSFKKADGGSLSLGEILAIVAIACVPFFFLGIPALVIGIIALQKINREGGASWARILAILAIVFGALEIVGLFFWLFFSVFVIARI